MAESLLDDVDNEEFHVEHLDESKKEQVRRDVFSTQEEAEERARAIGCVGTHSHDEDGETVYMPCESHEDYMRLTGDDVKADPEYLDIKTSLKAYNDEDEDKGSGEFEGYGSIFGNTDLGNDVIQKGAFKRSLRKRPANKVKLLYQHKTDMPIGVFDEIKEDDQGLFVKGRLALQTQAGKEAYELMKMGALDGLSIGFKVDPKGYNYERRTKRRVIDEVDLMEVSLVTFPMNPKAMVRSVKGQDISIREWENGLRDAFSISRSEAKAAAKAIVDTLTVRDAPDGQEILAIKTLTNILTGN